jgi:hypothetical protein
MQILHTYNSKNITIPLKQRKKYFFIKDIRVTIQGEKENLEKVSILQFINYANEHSKKLMRRLHCVQIVSSLPLTVNLTSSSLLENVPILVNFYILCLRRWIVNLGVICFTLIYKFRGGQLCTY